MPFFTHFKENGEWGSIISYDKDNGIVGLPKFTEEVIIHEDVKHLYADYNLLTEIILPEDLKTFQMIEPYYITEIELPTKNLKRINLQNNITVTNLEEVIRNTNAYIWFLSEIPN